MTVGSISTPEVPIEGIIQVYRCVFTCHC